MSESIIDTNIETLEAAVKAKKTLSKLYAQQVAAMDGAVDKAKARFKKRIDKLLAGLTPEVLELVKPTETVKVEQA